MNTWDKVLAKIKRHVDPEDFDRYFHTTLLLYEDEHRIIILVPSDFHVKHFCETRAAGLVKAAFVALNKPDLELYCIHKPKQLVTIQVIETDTG